MLPFAILLLLLAPATACDSVQPRSGCWGVSPTGITWRALMPEHSGTGTLADLFHDQLRVDTCGVAKNRHMPKVHEPPIGGCEDDVLPLRVVASTPRLRPGWSAASTLAQVYFVLAANPFRRVISAAAMRKIVAGGKRKYSKRQGAMTEIRAFRAWVRKLTAPPVRTAASLVASVRNLSYVVKTNQLQEDTLLLLDALGYPRQNFSRSHCISSCSTQIMRFHLKERARFQRENDPREFYDAVTAARVRRLYAEDFSMFAFSRDPAKMLE